MTLSLILVDKLLFPPRDYTALTSPEMLSQPTSWFWTNQCLKLDSLLSLSPDLKRTTFPPKLQLNYIIERSVVTSKRRHPYFSLFFLLFLSVFSATSVDYSSFADRCSSWIELIKLKAQTIGADQLRQVGGCFYHVVIWEAYPWFPSGEGWPWLLQ